MRGQVSENKIWMILSAYKSIRGKRGRSEYVVDRSSRSSVVASKEFKMIIGRPTRLTKTISPGGELNHEINVQPKTTTHHRLCASERKSPILVSVACPRHFQGEAKDWDPEEVEVAKQGLVLDGDERKASKTKIRQRRSAQRGSYDSSELMKLPSSDLSTYLTDVSEQP